MRDDEFDIGYRILDDDLIDAEGWRCGKVDDIEIDGKPGEPAQIEAILTGPGAYAPRLRGRLARLVSKIAGDEIVRVPWSEVEDVDAVVRLKHPAGELGLGEGDRRARRLVQWIPGS
jgi:sporulation protein YlmC with PRC-barrel domain